MTNSQAQPKAADGLDPQIAGFIAKMGEGWGAHPPLESLPFPEARRVAEAVRRPWTLGGPRMARTLECQVPCGAGEVRVRIYDPGPGTEPKGGLVYLHGGGWADRFGRPQLSLPCNGIS